MGILALVFCSAYFYCRRAPVQQAAPVGDGLSNDESPSLPSTQQWPYPGGESAAVKDAHPQPSQNIHQATKEKQTLTFSSSVPSASLPALGSEVAQWGCEATEEAEEADVFVDICEVPAAAAASQPISKILPLAQDVSATMSNGDHVSVTMNDNASDQRAEGTVEEGMIQTMEREAAAYHQYQMLAHRHVMLDPNP